FAEVAQRIKLRLPDAEPLYTPVPAFATLAAGFCVAQLGLNPAPPNTLIYHNVAPRKDDEEARANNQGERLAFARLPTGVRVVGVNAGYAFSFVQEDAEELRWASVPAGGSQFRSRDLFPEAAGDIVAGASGALASEIDPSRIPDVPNDRIVYVDGYGNLKTTVEHGALAISSGTVLGVRIGDVEREATASDGSFEVEEGELAFAPGSSGWPRPGGQEVRWMELFLRGGSAWEAFGRPGDGSRLEITPDL
ncbi:MAG TPA: hypothetical protein VGB40_08675, partial [Rubrobacteraceae bacterium]